MLQLSNILIIYIWEFFKIYTPNVMYYHEVNLHFHIKIILGKKLERIPPAFVDQFPTIFLGIISEQTRNLISA